MSTEAPTPYTVIGAGRSDSQAQLKAAYRKAASRLHPDRNPNRRDGATKEMAILNAAWEQLNTPERRALLDEALEAADAQRRGDAERRREREARAAADAAARRREAQPKARKSTRKRGTGKRAARSGGRSRPERSSTTITGQGSYSSVSIGGSTSTQTRSPSAAERQEAEAAAQSRTHRGDLNVDRRRHLTFSGTVTGTVTVGPGCSLDLTGAILGDLVVDGGGEGAQVRVLGTVGGGLRATSGDIEVIGSTSGVTISSSSYVQHG